MRAGFWHSLACSLQRTRTQTLLVRGESPALLALVGRYRDVMDGLPAESCALPALVGRWLKASEGRPGDPSRPLPALVGRVEALALVGREVHDRTLPGSAMA